jgi:hypothetical protein
MKKIIFVLFVFAFVNKTQAQVMAQKAQWVTITVPQLQCWTCKDKLEKYLFKEQGPAADAGILQWKINLHTTQIRIQYLPDRVDANYLRTAIANAGYDADSVKANPDSYKMLPPICKRKEDGGGQQKGAPPCAVEPMP